MKKSLLLSLSLIPELASCTVNKNLDSMPSITPSKYTEQSAIPKPEATQSLAPNNTPSSTPNGNLIQSPAPVNILPSNYIQQPSPSTPIINVVMPSFSPVNNSPSVTPSISDQPAIITPKTEEIVSSISPLEIKSIIDSGVVTANTRFGLKLFSELLKSDMKKNMFISPASVSIALTMTYNGADAETKTAMADTLALSDINIDEVNKANKLLIQRLQNPAPDIKLNIANSLWGNKNFTFKDDFINTNKNYFNASFNLVDFKDPNAPNLMNQWVNDSTQGKITKILEKIDEPEKKLLYLINAIYFKANWSKSFDKNNTKEQIFTTITGEQKMKPLMSSFDYYRFFHNPASQKNKFSGLAMDYGKDKRFSMYIFLPDIDSSLQEFYSNLNQENLDQWFTQFYRDGGNIRIPKFKLEYGKNLTEPLKNMGMDIAFDQGKANLKKIAEIKTDENIYISDVDHKTFVDVNEEGTEAAAVTVVTVSAAGSSSPTRNFVVDRPFFFLIRDEDTKEILFMGSIVDP